MGYVSTGIVGTIEEETTEIKLSNNELNDIEKE